MSDSWQDPDAWPGGFSPACVRNAAAIFEVLQVATAMSDGVLEIGSCTGQHAVYFAQRLAHLPWQPSDQAMYLNGLAENLAAHAPPNVASPVELDVEKSWPDVSCDTVFTANTLHIMSWPQVESFFAGLGELQPQQLLIYGPFNYDGKYTSDSNAQFDASLRARDPLSGIRDMADITVLAEQAGFVLEEDYEMPANNRLLVWSKLAE